MKTLYLDIFSGLSGDMFIGTLLDLGVDFHQLEHELEKLGLKEYHLHAARKHKGSIEGVKFDVHLAHDHQHSHAPGEHSDHHGEEHAHSHSHEPHGHTHHHGDDEEEHRHAHAEDEAVPGAAHEPPHHDEHEHSHGHSHSHSHEHGHEHHDDHEHEHAHGRTFADIKALINRSTLSDWVKQKAVAVFQRVANAEGKIHGQPPATVHFHEVGAIDSIVDIVGACIGLELLGRPHVLAAPAVEGKGWIECAHGRFPVPSAATLEILGARGIPLSQCDEPHELITPTGAALLAEFAESFGPMRGLTATKVGYGLGTRDNRGLPNVVRAVLGESTSVAPAAAHDWETDVVTVLETNVDDLSAEVLGHVLEQALALGALDAFHTPVLMKKNRPAVLLTVLCAQHDATRLSAFILRETSAFGIRHYPAERRKLRREFREIATSYGAVTVKLGWLDGKVVQLAPEYEACKAIAASTGIPLKEVHAAALQAAREAEL